MMIFFIEQFTTVDWLHLVYTFFTAIVIVISLIYSKGVSQFFGIAMTVVGGGILLYQGVDIHVWSESLLKNVPLVCLILIVPILGIPIGLGNYHEHLAGFTAKFQKRPGVLYLIVTSL